MRRNTRNDNMPPERQLAIGLVWGHLNMYQYEEAHVLAAGCLRLWPDDEHLAVLGACAAVEMMLPFDVEKIRALRNDVNADWVDLLLLRAQHLSLGADAPVASADKS